MKIFFLFFFVSLSVLSMAQQNNWDVVWTMDQLPFMAPQLVSELAIVKAGFDTDQDGKGEFLCAWTDMEENYTVMYEAVDDNQYELVWFFKHPVASNSFAGIAVGDIDNNDVVDIIMTLPSTTTLDPNPPRLWVFEWNGVVGENRYGSYNGEELLPTNEWNFGLPENVDFRPYSLTIEDIDKDDKNELIIGVRQGYNGREVIVASVNGELNGFGFWEIEYRFSQPFNGSLYSVTTGDLDNDGFNEIYAFIWNYFTLRIFEYDGAGNYNITTELDEIYSTQGIDVGALDAVRVADVNNDGVNEMYIAGTEPENSLFIITGINDVSQITQTDVKVLMNIPPINIGKFRTLYTADPDKDGNISLMIGGEGNGQIYEIEYTGAGDPADSTSWDVNVIFDVWDYSGISPDSIPTITPRFFYGHPASDMDGDGKDEYVFVNYSTDFPVWNEDIYLYVIEIDQAVGVKEDVNSIPQEFNLSQNYPNPFNPSTRISYSLAEAGYVNLKVYDILGNEVADLVSSSKPTGIHSVEFDASNLTSGVYIYTLKVNGYTNSKKMLLMK